MSYEITDTNGIFAKSRLTALGLTHEELAKPLVLIMCEAGCEAAVEHVKFGAITGGCAAAAVTMPNLCDLAARASGKYGLLFARESIADLSEIMLGLYPVAAVAIVASSESAAAGMVMGAVRRGIPLAFMPAFLEGLYFPSRAINTLAAIGCGKESISALEPFEGQIRGGRSGEMDNLNSLCVFLEGCGIGVMGAVGAFSVSEKTTSARTLGSLAADRALSLSYPRKDLNEASVTAGLAAFIAAGGTAAALLHIIAITAENGIKLSLKDIENLSEKVPLLARLSPFCDLGSDIAEGSLSANGCYTGGGTGNNCGNISGYSVVDFARAGGVAAILSQINKIPKLLSPTLTLGGSTIEAHLERQKGALKAEGKTASEGVVSPLESPAEEGGFAVMRGNLFDYGVFSRCVAAKKDKMIKGVAAVFDSEELFKAALSNRTLGGGSIAVVRGASAAQRGMPLLDLQSYAKAFGQDLVIITDGRVLETCPHASSPLVISLCCGDAMAVVKSGDPIELDLKKCKVNLNIAGKELSARLKKLRPEDTLSGGLLRYSSLVGEPENGCVLRNKF